MKTGKKVRGLTETFYSRSFLKYIHIRKKSKWNHQITGGDKAPRKHHLPSSKIFSARKGLHLIELLAKGAP